MHMDCLLCPLTTQCLCHTENKHQRRALCGEGPLNHFSGAQGEAEKLRRLEAWGAGLWCGWASQRMQPQDLRVTGK